MNLLIANISTIDDATMTAAVRAIALQVSRDFQPEWGVGANLTGQRFDLAGGQAQVDATTQAIIYVGTASQDPTTGVSGALGYHSANHAELPYGFIYLDICAEYQEVWTCTLSHETLELLADPTAIRTVPGPVPAESAAAGPTVSYDLEVCDPTQGDTYPINNVVVSNFVTQRYFGLPSTAQSTNFLRYDLAPFGVRPGGYFQYEDGNSSYQFKGQKVPESRIAARAKFRQYRRNGRREDRLKGGKILPY